MKNKILFLLLISSMHLMGCTQSTGNDSAPNTTVDLCADAGTPVSTEISECTTNTVYASPAVVSGTATFFKRTINISNAGPVVTALRLGAPIASALPIKYAEVRVLNSGGTIVQCGSTDSNGLLKALDGVSNLHIPNTAGNYTLEVLSRSNHNVAVTGGKPAFKFYASVKNSCSNTVHSISSTLAVAGAGTYSTSMTAYSRESESSTVAGGAFNIYNNLAVTYDYLAQNTALSNLSCLNSKLNVYWTSGFNPAQLIYPSEDPSTLSNISFYLRGYNELYINGGKLGNVSSADTDHFDDAVIIHELGHRVEDVCGTMDSPGGTHFGQFRIDPRLAWSEGWGNYFGAHMIRNNLSLINPELVTTMATYDSWLYYLDTSGYNDGATTTGTELIRINLSKLGSSPENLGGGYFYDKVDSSLNPGEGHFREVSVSRALFKNSNTCTANCGNTNYFPQLWKAFEKDAAGVGMGKSIYPFRSSVRFYNRLKTVFSGTLPASVSSTINTDEAQQPDASSQYAAGGFTTWVPYGIKLVSNGAVACPLKIQPRQEDITVTYKQPDQRFSNHFYYFDRASLSGVTTVNLNLTKVTGTNTDIDLILYQDGYSFPTENCTGTAPNCSAYSKNTTSSQFVKSDRSIASTPGTSYVKQITGLNFISSSTSYLLNIRAYTAGLTISSTTEYSYTLTDQSGNFLCPISSF